jgi:hypothetical protein
MSKDSLCVERFACATSDSRGPLQASFERQLFDWRGLAIGLMFWTVVRSAASPSGETMVVRRGPAAYWLSARCGDSAGHNVQFVVDYVDACAEFEQQSDGGRAGLSGRGRVRGR